MPEALLEGNPSLGQLEHQLLATTWTRRSKAWLFAFAAAGILTLLLIACMTYTLVSGIGTWGNNVPVAWAFAIVNFVWWIGIGHAGTFISAVLLLLEQRWRNSINRFAEAMTLFAVVQAALFPILHLGRPWLGYWLMPYPATMEVWPQIKSALPWDAAAIATYGLVSIMFWYLGLIPDLASMRDHAPTRRRRRIYGLFALGWNGSATTWRHYRAVYLVFAGLATPLVVSVHSIVGSDFAMGLVPGWHSTIFPPFFVAGAIFSGFAMVLTLLVPAREVFGLGNVVTARHLDNCAKLTLATGWMVAYGYAIEFFVAWYSGDPIERYQMFVARPTAPGSIVFWAMMGCNLVVPQLYWFRRVRRSPWMLFWTSILVNVGMWSERFVIVVISLEREFLPAQWGRYVPSWVDIGTLAGTIGFFLLLFLLFLRLIPIVPIHEVKELAHELRTGSGEEAPTDA